MDQSGYEFLPGFLIAQAGQTIQFGNSEDVLHNVRVAEASTQKPIFNVKAGHYNLTVYTGAAPVVRPIEVKGGTTELGAIQ